MNNFSNRKPKATLILKNVPCICKNFSGVRDRNGKRTFGIILEDENEALAQQLAQDGWNIKLTKTHKEGDIPKYWLPIEARYDNFPPTVVMVREGKPNRYMTETTISELDGLQIESISVNINPSFWDDNGERKVKAYLKSAIVNVEVDELMATLAEEEAPEEE